MTRAEELKAMTGAQLIAEADRIGVAVRCYRPAGKLTEAKAKVVERILEAEANAVEAQEEIIEEQDEIIEAQEEIIEAEAEEKEERGEPKRANKRIKEFEYKGETKTIREWAEQYGMPWPTLYDRINRNGWTIEEAIEIPLGQRRPKNREA